MIEGTSCFGDVFFRKTHQRDTESTVMMITPAETPTAIPTFAPVPSPVDGEEVAEGNDAVDGVLDI